MKKLKIVAVTKNRSVPEILTMLIKTGIKRIAENRLEEVKKKFPILPNKLEKHYIGKLQSRKIKQIVQLFDVIQSVENIEQAKKISICANEINKSISILIQINISKKENRSGVSLESFNELKDAIKKLPHLKLVGVMGMASHDPILVRDEFRLLKSLQGDLEECSMGMSEDYAIAIEEGSTMLRLGRLLFEHDLPEGLEYE